MTNILCNRIDFILLKIRTFLIKIFTYLAYRKKQERKRRYKQLRYNAEIKYLQRYTYALDNAATAALQPVPKIIWSCWWQGEENLPPVVKRCFESVHKYCPDYEFRLITENNLHQYIDFPDYIWKKYRKGIISRTLLSDLLRIGLLSRYGGIWLDATVYLTAPLPPKITETSFFAFHCREIYQFQSWFLKSAPNDIILSNLQKLFLEYFKHENRLLNYFFTYLAFDVVVSQQRACAEQWQNTPTIVDTFCYDLADNFFAPYSAAKWKQIKSATTVHKLSWKYRQTPNDDSFLNYLLRGELGA